MEKITEDRVYGGSFETVEALESAYTEQNTKFGAFKGYPTDGYSEDSSGTNFLKDWGQNNQLSQEGYSDLMEQYNTFNIEKEASTLKQAMDDLGTDANKRLENVRDYITANVGVDGVDALSGVLTNAKAIEAIESLISSNKSPTPSKGVDSVLTTEQVDSMRFAKDEYGNRKMDNPEYRAKVLELEAQINKG